MYTGRGRRRGPVPVARKARLVGHDSFPASRLRAGQASLNCAGRALRGIDPQRIAVQNARPQRHRQPLVEPARHVVILVRIDVVLQVGVERS